MNLNPDVLNHFEWFRAILLGGMGIVRLGRMCVVVDGAVGNGPVSRW